MKKTITVLSLLLFPIFSSVHAQSVLLSWDIPTTTNGATTTTPTSVNSAANNSAVSASTITMGPGIIGSVSNATTGWGSTSYGSTGNQTLDFCNTNNDWFYFAVTAKPGKVVTINGVGVLTVYGSGAGPGNWALLSSTNPAFTTTNTPATFTTNATFASGVPRAASGAASYTMDAASAFSTALAASNVVIQSGKTMYFRLVGYNGATATGTGRIIGTNSVDFTLLGSVADAPIQTFTWNGGSSGSWNYTDSNWLDGVGASSAFLPDNNATFIAGAAVSITNTGVSFGSLSNNVPAGQTTTLSDGSLGGSSVENAGAGNLVLQSTNSATTLANSGLGTLSLMGSGTYTTVNLTAGKIRALADGVLSGSVNASGGSTLDVGTFSNTIGSLVVSESNIDGTGILKGSGFSFALDQNDKTVAVSLQGIGGLGKTGSKILTLSGSNTFSGDITISGGTLATPGADRLPDTSTVVMSSNTILRLGGNETIKALSASSSGNSSQVDLQGYVLTLNVTASNSYAGSIVGTGSLVKNGSSIQTLTNSSTFSGGTTLNDGYFRLQASGNRTTNSDGAVTLASGPFGVGSLTLAGGAIYSSSLTSGRNIYNNADITGNFAFGDTTNASGKITVSKEVTGAYTRLLANSTFTANADTDWEQPILGSGFSLSKGGASKLTLLSTNSLSTLAVLAGVLDVRGSNSISQINVAGGGAALAYGASSAPFGAATINLSNSAIFGQSSAIGTTLSDRTIPNPINVLGDVFLGIGAVTGSGGYGSYLSGNVNLGGTNRTLTVANSAYFYGAVTNGGMNVMRNNTDLGSTKTLGLYGMNSYSGGTTVNGSVDYVYNPILLLGNDRALGSGSLNLAGGGSLTIKAVSKADDIYNASRIISNGISIATGVSGVFDAGTNSVTSLDGSLTGIVTNNMTLMGAISGQGSLVKTNNGNLILTGPLSYAGATTVMDGNLVVVKTNLTATVSSNTVGIYFSNNVSAGTYAVLPGALNGTYSEAMYNNLSQGQSANFNASTGSVTVTGNPTSSGPSFADSYPGQSLTDLASNGLSYLMNYALGGSSANGSSVPVSSTDSNTLSITAIVRINDLKCQIVGEATTSLTAWPTNIPISGVPAADQSGAVAGVTQKQVFSVNRGTDLKKFLRLKAIYTQ